MLKKSARFRRPFFSKKSVGAVTWTQWICFPHYINDSACLHQPVDAIKVKKKQNIYSENYFFF